MIIISDSRVSGKTTEAIKLASATRSVLVVPTGDVARMTRRHADEMKFPVEVYPAREYFEKVYRRNPIYGTRPVIIDELDWVLREVFGAKVIMATTTGAMLGPIKINSGTFVSEEQCYRNEYLQRPMKRGMVELSGEALPPRKP